MISRRRAVNIFAISCCALFILIASLWIRKPGIQTDEALFAAGIYQPFGDASTRVSVFGHEYSLMVMTYVGSLKARIWSPILRFLGTSAATVRIPAILIGAVGIWWFYRLMLRTLGIRAALLGCALLATDSAYMLTIRLDWGPVALQHALMIGGMLAIVRWWQERGTVWLALGFFCFGLAMWDKALFVWSLGGLGIATLAVFPRELWRSLRPKLLAVAAGAFLIGAFPLLLYNIRNNWVTFTSNAAASREDFLYKLKLVRATIDTSSMLGSVTRPDEDGPPRPAAKLGERIIRGIAERTGRPSHSAQLVLLVFSVLCLPFYWHTPARKAVLFAVLFMAVTWIQMAALQNGGTGMHHVILLWPMPPLIVAAGFGALTQRMVHGKTVLIGLTLFCIMLNLLVTASYYRELLRNGGGPSWSDAIYSAAADIQKRNPRPVFVIEWGFWDTLRLLGRGKLPLFFANDPAGSDDDRKYARMQVSNPDAVFVTHVPGAETEPGRAERIVAFAAAEGYRKTHSRIWPDSNGRPVIEVFSFARAE